jgi:hypothetical protein
MNTIEITLWRVRYVTLAKKALATINPTKASNWMCIVYLNMNIQIFLEIESCPGELPSQLREKVW